MAGRIVSRRFIECPRDFEQTAYDLRDQILITLIVS
jgi:hypothetical protein